MSISLEFEIGISPPVNFNVSGSLGNLEKGWFWEVDGYYYLGVEFGGYIGGGPIASVGGGVPQLELGVGFTWIF